MADTERRYGPTIDLQGFDLTMNIDAVHQPSRLPLVVVIALVVLAAFAGVVWLAYTQGVERGRESVSSAVAGQQFWGPRKPATPAYTGLKIYEPPAAAEQSTNEKPSGVVKRQATNTIPSLRPTASAATDTGTPLTQPVPATAALDQVGGSPALPEEKTKTAGTAAVPPGPPQRVATHAPTELAKPPAAPPLTTHPLTEPDSLAPAQTATPPAPSPRKAVTATPPAVPAASQPAAASTHAGASGILLQIGSYKSDAEARASWQSFKSEHDAAAGYQPDVKEVDLGARGTWYRLRIGPFADKSSALETCRKLKTDGASCLLAQ